MDGGGDGGGERAPATQKNVVEGRGDQGDIWKEMKGHEQREGKINK